MIGQPKSIIAGGGLFVKNVFIFKLRIEFMHKVEKSDVSLLISTTH